MNRPALTPADRGTPSAPAPDPAPDDAPDATSADAAFFRTMVDQMDNGVYFVNRRRRITYWSQGAATITGYPADRVIGKGCRDNLLNHVDDTGTELCRSRCPVAATMRDGEPREAHVYLVHADGHRLPVWVRAAPLRDATGVVIGAVETFGDDTAALAARARLAELEPMAMTDPLTRLGNRHALDAQLAAQLAEWTLHHVPFGVLMADIDRFKLVNDTYGHAVGDDALRLVGRTLSYAACSAGTLTPVRYGGEEFVIVVDDATAESLERVADLLRGLVEASRMTVQRQRIPLTISIGATLVAPGDDADTILARADLLLYEAKQSGRNAVQVG